jgi:hypothetical protein
MKAIHLSRLNLYKLTTWVIENEKRLYSERVTREEVARQAEEALSFRVNVSHVNVIIQNHELNITSTRSAPKTFMKSAWNKATDERLDALEVKLGHIQDNNDLNLKAIDKALEDIQDKLRRLEGNLPGAFNKLVSNTQFPLRGI